MEKFNKVYKNILNESESVDDIIASLFYSYTDEDDMTMAGKLDSIISDKLFGGDYEEYEDADGYGIRDDILAKVAKVASSSLKKKLKI